MHGQCWKLKRKAGDALSDGLQVIHESPFVPAFSTALTPSPFSMKAPHTRQAEGAVLCTARCSSAKPDDVQEWDNLGAHGLHQGFGAGGRFQFNADIPHEILGKV